MYLPDSNVLVTRFLSPEGVGEVVDFMPVQDPSRGKKTAPYRSRRAGRTRGRALPARMPTRFRLRAAAASGHSGRSRRGV